MEKTITFEMKESEAQKFEKILDATLEILTRMEKESPDRDARFDATHKEIMQNLNEAEKTMTKTSQRMAEWEIALGK